jgi:hypothetical protein
MSRAKRLQVPIVLTLVAAVYLFHSRYEIVVRGSGGGGGGRQQRAARGPFSDDVRTTEKHVGAEDPAGHVFIPKNEPRGGGSLMDGGGDGGGRGGTRRNVSVNTYLPALSPLTRNRDAVCCTAVPKYAVLSVFHTLISTRACTLLLCHATDLRSSRGATTADSHTATHAQSSHTRSAHTLTANTRPLFPRSNAHIRRESHRF